MSCHLDSNRPISEQTAFFYPTQSSATSSKPPGDTLHSTLEKQNKENNNILNLTQGKVTKDKEAFVNYDNAPFDGNYSPIYAQFLTDQQIGVEFRNNYIESNNFNPFHQGLGRTLNVPKISAPGTVPGPSYNGGEYIGEKCVGNHCSTPIEPTLKGWASNLKTFNSSVGTYHLPGTYRPGNSSDIPPNIVRINNISNLGPYNLEVIQADGNTNYAKF